MVQEIQQVRVGVVGVLDEQHDRLRGGQPLEEQAPSREQFFPGEGLVCPGEGLAADPGIADTEQPAQPCADVAPLCLIGDQLFQPGGEFRRRGIDRVVFGDREPLADDLGQGPERGPFPVGKTAAPVPPDRAHQPVGVLLEFPAQPGLPDARRPRHQHQPRHPALGRRVKQLPDRAQFPVPPGQRSLQPVHPLGAAHPGQHPLGFPQRLRPRLALQRMLARGGEGDRSAGQPPGGRVHQHRAALRGGLHPGGGVHRIPGHHPLAHRPQGDRDLTGHHPAPCRKRPDPCVRSELGNRRDQVQRGAHAPLGVLLGRDGGAPHGHHRVPDELLHHPAIPADHGPRHGEVLRQQFPYRFRVP